MSLGHHLGADQDVELACFHRVDEFLRGFRSAHRVAGHNTNPRFRQQLSYFFGDAFHARAAGNQGVLVFTFGANLRRRNLIATMMALQAFAEPVLG